MKRRVPFGTCRAEAEAGCEVMVLKVDAQPTGCLMLAAARGMMMGCEADGGTDVADVPPRLQGRSVEEGCKAGGGQLAPGAVAAGLCGLRAGTRRWLQSRVIDAVRAEAMSRSGGDEAHIKLQDS